jgi:hypothetical protein
MSLRPDAADREHRLPCHVDMVDAQGSDGRHGDHILPLVLDLEQLWRLIVFSDKYALIVTSCGYGSDHDRQNVP